jgi:hypothetical protein
MKPGDLVVLTDPEGAMVPVGSYARVREARIDGTVRPHMLVAFVANERNNRLVCTVEVRHLSLVRRAWAYDGDDVTVDAYHMGYSAREQGTVCRVVDLGDLSLSFDVQWRYRGGRGAVPERFIIDSTPKVGK